MSEIKDSWKYDSESRDRYQDRSTPGTSSCGSTSGQTSAKTYTHSAKKGKDKEMSKGPENGCHGHYLQNNYISAIRQIFTKV